MLSESEITAGTARLVANKLKSGDQETLVAVFRLYLKNRAGEFPDLSERVSAATDSNESKLASKLAAILIVLEENGFDLSELKGGRSGLQTNQAGVLALKIRFAIALLGYELPDEFSGAVENGSENFGGGGFFIPSTIIERKAGW